MGCAEFCRFHDNQDARTVEKKEGHMNAVAAFAKTGATPWEPVPSSTQWNHVTPLVKASPWLIDTLKALAGLSGLQDNWDGYGSPSIQSAALTSARRLVSAIEAEELPTPAVGPVSGGGIGIVWKVATRELQIEILPDGSVEFLLADVDSATGQERTQEGRLTLAYTDQIRRLVGWLLRG
jgi:hypothetical protein